MCQFRFFGQLLTSLCCLILFPAGQSYGQDLDCFVDMSGSMEGQKALAARAGAELLVWMLDDTFSVRLISFDDQATASTDFNVGSQRSDAQKWITALRTGGGTDYLAALQAGRQTSSRVGVFLSDGAHAGDADGVLTFVRKNWVGNGTLHTIAVECPANSSAEILLQQMAALTGGSFTRVEESEELVKALVNIATRLGKYRSWTPKQAHVQLNQCQGRLMAFAYDGMPAINADSRICQVQRQHRAVLPAEDVFATIADLSSATDVSLSLASEGAARAWLGDIHRNDLPVANVQLPTQNGITSAGQPLDIGISFSNPDGSKPDRTDNLSGKVSVIDNSGHIVSENAAIVVPNESRLNVRVPLPVSGGDFQIRTETTVRSADGHGFSAIDEQQIRAVPPVLFEVSPRVLSHKGNSAAFAVKLKIEQKNQDSESVDYQPALVSNHPQLRLLRSESADGNLTMHFAVSQPGEYSGNLKITGAASVPVTPVSVPYKFEITPQFAGLTVPMVRDINLGIVLVGSGPVQKTLRFASADESPQTYDISLSNLSSGKNSIPLHSPQTTFQAEKKTPGSLSLECDIDDSPPGQYTGKLVVSGMAGDVPTKWIVNLSLSISESLEVDPVPLIVLPVGTVKTITVVIRNTGKTAARHVSLVAPTAMAGPTGDTEQLLVTTDSKPAGIAAGGFGEFVVNVAASPLLETTGVFQGTAVVRRESEFAIDVPLRIQLVAAEDAIALFSVAPEKLRQDATAGQAFRIEINIKANADLKRPETVTVGVEAFVSDGATVTVTEQHRFSDGNTLKPRQTLKCELFFVAPNRPGVYQSTISVKASGGSKTVIPIEIHVK